MNLEALQKLAEQSVVEQWETLLSQFQSDTNSIELGLLNLECCSKQWFGKYYMPLIIHVAKEEFFEAINAWGDPRLRHPMEEDYWVELSVADAPLLVGIHLVTIKEWLHFLETEYDNDDNWSIEGLNWRDNRRVTWQQLASAFQTLKSICLIINLSLECLGLKQRLTLGVTMLD